LKGKVIEKTINKKTCKREGITKKKMELKFDRKKPNKDEIKKIISQTRKIAIKRIRNKLKRLKKSQGVKLKIICIIICYL